MMSEYLWDKTGEDGEIEGLETVLSGFRYQPMAPPALPVAISVATTKASWWKFSLAFAVPACLLLAMVIGFWLTRQGAERAVTQPIATQNQTPDTTPAVRAAEPEFVKEATPQIVRTIFTPEPKHRSRNLVQTSLRKRQPKFDTLTSEELDAYNQVKLALSITSSKLKVVSDTINRAED